MSQASVPGTSPGYQFRSFDLDEFREVVGQRIRPAEFFARFARHEATLRQHRAKNLGFSVIRVDPGIDIAVDPVDDSYLFQIPLAGSFRARCHGAERSYDDGSVHVVNPAAPIRIACGQPTPTFLVIRFARSTFAEHARVLADAADDGDCLLPESLPMPTSEGASLCRYLMYLHAESMAPGSALKDGVASRAAEQLLSSLMLSVAKREGEAARRGRVDDRAVDQAEEYIDAHMDDDIGLVDIVGIAGVDARTLDSGFRRRRGAGPLSWLARRRSERTAHELGPDSEPRAASASCNRPPLATRELEIAKLVAAGFNNLEIANALAISRNTVKDALKRIFSKVGVDSRAELVLRLSEAGLL
jgi:DNA-binding CsgD family transcriptional regulator